VAARADIIGIRIEEIERPFDTIETEKVVIVRVHDVRRAHALHRVRHFCEIMAVIEIIRVPDVFDIEIRKYLARIFDTPSGRLVYLSVGDKEAIGQPHLVRVPEKSECKEVSSFKRHHDCKTGRHLVIISITVGYFGCGAAYEAVPAVTGDRGVFLYVRDKRPSIRGKNKNL
jgi:hypothetical protein